MTSKLNDMSCQEPLYFHRSIMIGIVKDIAVFGID